MLLPRLTLVLAAGLLVAAMPVHSANLAPVVVDPMVHWIKSDGSSGATPLSLYERSSGTDGLQTCGGTAPAVNGCTLTDVTNFPNGGGWSVGFVEPSTPLAPGGAFIGSTVVALTGSKHVDPNTWTIVDAPYTMHWGCNWVLVNVFGVLVGDANCGDVVPRTAYPAGTLTADFHAGAYQGGLPASYGGWNGLGVTPDGNAFEAGVGIWTGKLEAS